MGTAIGGPVGSVRQSVFGKSVSPASFLKFAAVAGLLLLLYTVVLIDLVHAWNEEPGASHGYLIPPMALWIAWMRRRITFAQPVVPDNRGIWLTAVGSALLLLGTMAAEYFVTRLSLLVLLAGLTWTFWGVPRLRTLSFPLLLLV